MARLVNEIAGQDPAVTALDILYTENTYSETLITRDQYQESRPYLYQVLAGVELKIQNEGGVRVIGPGNDAFDQAVQGATSAVVQDLELADAFSRALESGISVVLAIKSISGPETQGVTLPYPSPARAVTSGPNGSLGIVGVRLDQDGVLGAICPTGSTRIAISFMTWHSNAVAQYQDAGLRETPRPGGEEYAEILAGKIVFIGVTDPSAEDLVPTPYSGAARMSGVEFHAAATDTILKSSYITETPGYQVILIVLFLGASAVVLGRFVKPAFGMAGGLALPGGLFAGWWGGFSGADYALPIAAPLAALAAGYLVATADRVGIEQLEKQQARSMLSRYLPSGLVNEMIKDRRVAQLGAKRAEVTVLFADIPGFTTLSEKLHPEEVVLLLNEYLNTMTQVIFSHEGSIDKFEGVGLLRCSPGPS